MPEAKQVNYDALPDQLYTRERYRSQLCFNPYAKPAPEQVVGHEVYIKDGKDYALVKVVRSPADGTGPAPVPIPPVDDEIQKKRDRLLGLTAVSFHYLDKNTAKESYRQELDLQGDRQSPDRTQIIQVMENNQKVEVKPPMIEGLLGSQKKIEIHEEFSSVPLTEEAMFLEYQRNLVRRQQVTIDLEFENRKPERLTNFDNVIRFLRQNFPTALAADDEIGNIRKAIAKEATAKRMHRFHDGGRLIIEATFAIERPKDGLIKLVYAFSSRESAGQGVRVEVKLKIDRICDNWKDQYEMEDYIHASIFGIPTNWDQISPGSDTSPEYRIISVKPLAIYS